MFVCVGCGAKKRRTEEKESLGKMETEREFTATAEFSMRPPITEICGRGLTTKRFWRKEGGGRLPRIGENLGLERGLLFPLSIESSFDNKLW